MKTKKTNLGFDLYIHQGEQASSYKPDEEVWNLFSVRLILERFNKAAEYRVKRMAIAAFFVGGFVFLGIRWLMFGG